MINDDEKKKKKINGVTAGRSEGQRSGKIINIDFTEWKPIRKEGYVVEVYTHSSGGVVVRVAVVVFLWRLIRGVIMKKKKKKKDTSINKPKDNNIRNKSV